MKTSINIPEILRETRRWQGLPERTCFLILPPEICTPKATPLMSMWSISRTLFAVRADPATLRELLEALLDNALLYTPSGGRCGVRAEPGAGTVSLSVWDTGPGIPEVERGQVFDRFFRGVAAQASGRPGSGLGLAIVKAIADAHGARLSLGDRPGGGAVFSVELPLGEDGTVSGPAPVGSSRRGARRTRP